MAKVQDKRMSKTNKSPEKANSKPGSQRSSRKFDDPIREHLIVLQALEIANRAFNRIVSVTEIIQALSTKEKLELDERYKRKLSQPISKILGLLCKKGKVFKSARIGKRCFYGLVGLLDLENTNLDDFQSRRSRVLDLVKIAIVENGRALQMGEIIEFAGGASNYSDLDPALISGSVLSLKETGELVKFPLRGSEKGFGIYLLHNMNPSEYLPKEPINWLEFVLKNFNELWNDRQAKASKNDIKPSPLSIAEIRAKLIAENSFSEKFQDTQLLSNALVQLTRTANPSLRKIRKPRQKGIFWLPVRVKDDEVNLAVYYQNDKERIKEAVRRASLRLKRPVNISEIKEEMEIDADLAPVSKATYRSLLADAARNPNYKRKRKLSSDEGVYRFGIFQKTTFYYFKNEPNADSFIKFRLLKHKWEKLNPTEEINRIEPCILPCVAFGRMKLLSSEIQHILEEVKKLLSLNKVVGFSKKEVKAFLNYVSKKKLDIESWLMEREDSFADVPQNVQSIAKGWTVDKLKEIITPFYYRIATGKNKATLQALIDGWILRIPNPNFQRTNLKDSLLATKYFYDEVDALIYIGKNWGGIESQHHASIAHTEIGFLRDPRFIIPALNSKDFNKRLCAVSCLAFLPSKDGNAKLIQLATNDIDVGVRQSALWACAFIDKEKAIAFIQKQALQDKDVRVRDFAKKIVENYRNGWFSFVTDFRD
ncbi:MAG TPA: HEAT repeat domain-containing protein [Pyrinomonadaceae bacterium]|jgi:hypothetical protein